MCGRIEVGFAGSHSTHIFTCRFQGLCLCCNCKSFGRGQERHRSLGCLQIIHLGVFLYYCFIDAR